MQVNAYLPYVTKRIQNFEGKGTNEMNRIALHEGKM